VAYLVGDGADVRWAASMVVVTHGADGVSVTTRSSWQVCPAHEVDVVDTIGAGDSFMAALLDGLARRDHLTVDGLRRIPGDTAAAAVDDAARAAAITCGRAGADPPTREELDASIAAEPA
jgi:fructokinase